MHRYLLVGLFCAAPSVALAGAGKGAKPRKDTQTLYVSAAGPKVFRWSVDPTMSGININRTPGRILKKDDPKAYPIRATVYSLNKRPIRQDFDFGANGQIEERQLLKYDAQGRVVLIEVDFAADGTIDETMKLVYRNGGRYRKGEVFKAGSNKPTLTVMCQRNKADKNLRCEAATSSQPKTNTTIIWKRRKDNTMIRRTTLMPGVPAKAVLNFDAKERITTSVTTQKGTTKRCSFAPPCAAPYRCKPKCKTIEAKKP